MILPLETSFGPRVAKPRLLLDASVVAAWLFVALPVQGGVAKPDGRYRADYQNSETSLTSASYLQQQLDVGIEDRLFGANDLRINVTTQRYSDIERGLSRENHRFRFQLTGNAYGLTGIYAPRNGTGFGVEGQGDETEDLQLAWQYSAPRMPTVRATYRSNEHFTSEGLVGTRSREKSVGVDHEIGFVKMSGLWRRIDYGGETYGNDRGQEYLSGRLNARRAIARGVTADLTLDLQDADTHADDGKAGKAKTRNVRAGLSWTGRRNLKAHLNVLDRKTTNRSEGVDADGLNREVSARLLWLPITSVKVDIRRDVRDVVLGVVDTHSDIVRYQGSWNGRLRSRMRGRLNLTKNQALSTRNVAAPADNADLTVDAEIFRDTTLRTTLSVSHRHGDTTALLGRYGIQRYLDLRSRLNRRFTCNFTWRATLNADDVRFTDSSYKGTTAGLIYTGSRGLSASAAYRRSVDVTRGGSIGNALTVNVNMIITKAWLWTASGTVSDTRIDDEKTKEGNTTFVRTTYKIGPQTSFHVSWFASTPAGGNDSSGMTASFTTAF